MTGRHLRLVAGHPPPPVGEVEGRPVRWDPWKPALVVTHLSHKCDGCGFAGQHLTAVGTAAPLEGETYRGETRRRLRRSGRETWPVEADVPAWPIRRLHATRCPECGAVGVFDMGQDMQGWAPVGDPAGQATLF